jgi:hypothetical protein
VISDPISGAASRPATSPDLLPADLPAWAPALPLWAGARWLWLSLALDGLLRYWCGGAVAERGQATLLSELPVAPPYPLIVLDYGAASFAPDLWTQLAALLAAGGVLFVCGPRQNTLPAQIRATAAGLRPATWHVLEPGVEGYWRLRPDQATILHLLDANLQPPDTLRDWLHQVQRRWRPVRQVACLPVWRDTEAP